MMKEINFKHYGFKNVGYVGGYSYYENEKYPYLTLSCYNDRYDEEITLNIQINNIHRNHLMYDEFSKLPHFEEANSLVKFKYEYLNEEVINKIMNAIGAYYEEYYNKLKKLILSNN